MQPKSITNSGAVASATTVQRVVPLLQALSRLEDEVSVLVMRLDPVIDHVPTENDNPPVYSVTGRLNTLGDTLQYLLDNIEL